MYAIREASTGILKDLTIKFGGEWAAKNLIPKATTLAKDTNYLHRYRNLFHSSLLIGGYGSSQYGISICAG